MNRRKEILREVIQRPTMFMMGDSYGEHVALIQGMNMGVDTPMLEGFSQSLSEQLGFGSDLCWAILVLYLAFPNTENPIKEMEGDQSVAIGKLYELVDKHLTEKEK